MTAFHNSKTHPKMTHEVKSQTVAALKQRLAAGETQANIGKRAGVNSTYMSLIANGKWEVTTGSGRTTIPDYVWRDLRNALGLERQVFETSHYQQITGLLAEAKERGLCRIIDGDTGMGKSFSIDEFQRLVPVNTYVVRCTNAMTTPEFVKAIAATTGAGLLTGTKQALLEAVARKLMREDQPILIIDEAETMVKKAMSLSLLKDLYVLTNGSIGIVLVGANDFINKLRVKASYKVENFPQLLSRFGTSPLMLAGLNYQDAARIATQFGVRDRKSISDLLAIHPNYREFLEALRQRQADEAAVLMVASTSNAA